MELGEESVATKCLHLAWQLEETQTDDLFRVQIAEYLRQIFGFEDGGGGWFARATSIDDQRSLVALLRPTGPLMRRIIAQLEERRGRYLFPVSLLPPPVQEQLRSPPLTPLMARLQPLCVHEGELLLNVFDFFVLCFLSFACNMATPSNFSLWNEKPSSTTSSATPFSSSADTSNTTPHTAISSSSSVSSSTPSYFSVSSSPMSSYSIESQSRDANNAPGGAINPPLWTNQDADPYLVLADAYVCYFALPHDPRQNKATHPSAASLQPLLRQVPLSATALRLLTQTHGPRFFVLAAAELWLSQTDSSLATAAGAVLTRRLVGDYVARPPRVGHDVHGLPRPLLTALARHRPVSEATFDSYVQLAWGALQGRGNHEARGWVEAWPGLYTDGLLAVLGDSRLPGLAAPMLWNNLALCLQLPLVREVILHSMQDSARSSGRVAETVCPWRTVAVAAVRRLRRARRGDSAIAAALAGLFTLTREELAEVPANVAQAYPKRFLRLPGLHVRPNGSTLAHWPPVQAGRAVARWLAIQGGIPLNRMSGLELLCLAVVFVVVFFVSGSVFLALVLRYLYRTN